MQTIEQTEPLRQKISDWRRRGELIAFVPTMGNLHAGHMSLVEEARRRARRVVVSIFVNPMQFGPGEDFERYPRTLAEDSRMLKEAGVDLLFAPTVAEIYPRGHGAATRIEVPEVSEGLCGEFRPGHFVGVATVVAKLFNLVQPDIAVFGQKDYQQLAVIRRMVTDLCFPIEIIGAPTVREADGLALSSRNGYLSASERARAPLIYQLLSRIARAIGQGARDFRRLEAEAEAELKAAGFEPEYISVRQRETLKVAEAGDRALVVLAAARLGTTRLIDNLEI